MAPILRALAQSSGVAANDRFALHQWMHFAVADVNQRLQQPVKIRVVRVELRGEDATGVQLSLHARHQPGDVLVNLRHRLYIEVRFARGW